MLFEQKKKQSRRELIFAFCCVIAICIGVTPVYAGIGDLLVSVLGWIISGISKFILGIIETVAQFFLTVMAVDISQIESFGFLDGFNMFVLGIRALAIGIAGVILIFQLYPILFGPFVGAKQTSSVGGIIARALIFIPLTYAIQPLALETLRMFQSIYTAFLDVYNQKYMYTDLSSQIDPNTFLEDLGIEISPVFSGDIGPLAQVASVLIACTFMIVITWNFVKLLLEMTQRFVVMLIYVYLSPLATACGVGVNSISIVKQSLTMFLSSGVLWILNVWSVSIALSLFAAVGQSFLGGAGGFFLWAVITYGFLKIAQQLDDVFNAVGATNVRFSGSLLDDLVSMSKMSGAFNGVARGIGNLNRNLTNFAENGFFGGGRGSNPNNPVQPTNGKIAPATGKAATPNQQPSGKPGQPGAGKPAQGAANGNQAARSIPRQMADGAKTMAGKTVTGRVVRGVKQTADNVRSRVGAGVAEANMARDNRMMGAVGNALGKENPQARAAAMKDLAKSNPQALKNDAVRGYVGEAMGLQSNQSVAGLSVDKDGQLAATVATTSPDGSVTMSKVTGLNDMKTDAPASHATGQSDTASYKASELGQNGANLATMQYMDKSGQLHTAQVEKGELDTATNGQNSLFTVTADDGQSVSFSAPRSMSAEDVGKIGVGEASPEMLQKLNDSEYHGETMSSPGRIANKLNIDYDAPHAVAAGTAIENSPDSSFTIGGADGAKFERVDAGGGVQGSDVWSASVGGKEVDRFEAPAGTSARDVAGSVMTDSGAEFASVREKTCIASGSNPDITFTQESGAQDAATPGVHSNGTNWGPGIKMAVQDHQEGAVETSSLDFRYGYSTEEGGVVMARGCIEPLGESPEMPAQEGKTAYLFSNNHGDGGKIYLDSDITPEQLAEAIVKKDGGGIEGVREIREALGINDSLNDEESKQLRDVLEKARRAKKGILTSEDNPVGEQ